MELLPYNLKEGARVYYTRDGDCFEAVIRDVLSENLYNLELIEIVYSYRGIKFEDLDSSIVKEVSEKYIRLL